MFEVAHNHNKYFEEEIKQIIKTIKQARLNYSNKIKLLIKNLNKLVLKM